jgi:hypothetical protein
MKDVIGALRKKYYQLLNGSITVNSDAVPVYYKYVPNTINKPYYIVLSVISNVDKSTKQTRRTDTSMRVSIFTKDTIANSGSYADQIAEQVKAIITPNPVNNTIDLEPDFQCILIRPEGDVSPDAMQTKDAIFINRFLTFSHEILHRQ